jgi:hypothetical protein
MSVANTCIILTRFVIMNDSDEPVLEIELNSTGMHKPETLDDCSCIYWAIDTFLQVYTIN